jgi:Tol biopolymer transport system component
MSPDGGRVARLTPDEEKGEAEPSWSPDGARWRSRLAMVRPPVTSS